MDRLKTVDPRVYSVIGVLAVFAMAFLVGYGQYIEGAIAGGLTWLMIWLKGQAEAEPV